MDYTNIFDILWGKEVNLRGKHPIIINREEIFRFFRCKFNDYNPLKKKDTDNQWHINLFRNKIQKHLQISDYSCNFAVGFLVVVWT